MTTVLVRSGLLTHVWDLATRLTQQGIRVAVAVPKNAYPQQERLVGPLRTLPVHFYRSEQSLRRFARRWHVDLVHAHSPRTFNASTRLAQRLQVPLVVTLHGVGPWLQLYPRTMSTARRIIAVGPAQSWWVRQEFPDKVRLIPNGVDLKRFHPAPPHRHSNADDRLRVLWYGRAGRVLSRGVEVLDTVAGQCRDRLHVRMVGLAHGAKLRHIAIRGWVRDAVPELQRSDVVLGHGRSIREGMACGNVGILLMHRYGGIVDSAWFRTPEYTMGALPEYHFMPAPKVEQLAADLMHLDRDRSLLHRLRAESRRLAERFFDVRRMVGDTLLTYREATARSGSSVGNPG